MRTTLPILLTAAITLPCTAQRLTVVLDAARGGSEYGARIDGRTYEKQVTLDLANRLRQLLQARDFNVVLTRENDALVTNEQRAAIANQNKPVACLLLHATSSGKGLHLWTTSLTAAPVGSTAVLWDEAQSPFVDRSQRFATEFATAFSRSRLPVSSGHTWIRPLDNMQCPAVAIEIAPQDGDTPASDRDYQNRIAGVIANELLFWRGHADVVESILNPPPPPPAAPKPAITPQQPASSPNGTITPRQAPRPRPAAPAPAPAITQEPPAA